MDKLIPISEAKARLAELVRDAADSNVVLMRHGRPTALLVSPARYEALVEQLEDALDRLAVYEGRELPEDMRISLEKAGIELGLE